jgi:hypothetical protein
MNWLIAIDVLLTLGIVVQFLNASVLIRRVQRLESQQQLTSQLLDLARRAREPAKCAECEFSGTRESVVLHRLQEHLT